MINNSKFYAYQLGDLYLTDTASTRSGIVFNPRNSQWTYRDGGEDINIDFTTIKKVSPDLLLGLKLTLLWYAENLSPAHTRNMFWYTRELLRVIAKDKVVSEITDLDIMNFRASLGVNKKWYLSLLAGFLKKWHALGVPGVTKEAVDLLGQLRNEGNPKGEAVLTMDPIDGPFTNNERVALCNALNEAYLNCKIKLEDYVLCLLVASLGYRPVQYSFLKICDFHIEERADNSLIYILRVPRVKQRGILPRTEFKERILAPQIGELLYKHVQKIDSLYAMRLNDTKQAPMFPDGYIAEDYVGGFKFHSTSSSISRRTISAFAKLNVISERTGDAIHITPTRFRRTIGTQAAVEGHAPLVIAELLDHTDLQNVGVYVSAMPEIIERIDRAVAAKLAPLAQAFAGILVDGKTELDVPHGLRIVAPKQSQGFVPVGSCGQHGFCGFAAPVACYTCSSFHAWLDGPHEEILEYLVAERDRLISIDVRIATVNDRTILAVAQVVEMCKNAQCEQDSDV